MLAPVPSAPPRPLSQAETSRGLRLVVLDGMASQVMAILAGGVFLTAYALSLGASHTVIGMIAAIPLLAQVFQVPAVMLVEKLRRRRLVTVGAALAGRIALLGVVAAVLLPGPWALGVLLASLTLYSAFGAVAGCAWNAWMRDLVPQATLGRFFGRRLFAVTALGAVVSYAAARWLGEDAGPQSYALLALIGAAAGFLGVALLARTPEPAMPPPAAGRLRLGRLLAEPFRDTNFRHLMVFLGVWGFALNLAAPFFTVFLLQDVGLPLATVIPLTVVGQVTNLAVLGLWGRLTDRLGNAPVLKVCVALHVVVLTGWTFVTFPGVHGGTLPLLVVLHAVLGVATAGVTLAAGTIALKLAPAGRATAYLAMNGMIANLGAGIAPLAGGLLADQFAGQTLAFSLSWTGVGGAVAVDTLHLAGWDFFFAMAAGLALYALRRLSLVQEPGAVRARDMLGRGVALMGPAGRTSGGPSGSAGGRPSHGSASAGAAGSR